MSTTLINDGGPAFPWSYMGRDSCGQEVTREQGMGMTLRDYFAGMALQGILSGTSCPGDRTNAFQNAKYAAKWSYDFADAMIEEKTKHH